jgi:protein-L-isoaspartate(D-aspartate) O-methyltransferase
MAESQLPRDDPFHARRLEMVADQIEGRGILDEKVLSALRAVPRERFVLPGEESDAYRDCPLSIGFGQTISQPYTVAFMVAALELTGDEKVLEVGTGSGYQAAVLSHLAREVHTVERIPELEERARGVLTELGYTNVHVHLANGTLGWKAAAPYDVIVVAAGSWELPSPLQDQLVEGGRIVIPIGPTGQTQKMYRFTLRHGELKEEDLGRFSFVPLIGKHGWQE